MFRARKCHRSLSAIADEQAEKLNVYKVNTNFDSELAEKYSVMSVPTIVLFKDGEEIARKSGAEKKAVLEEWITQSLDK
ncbi:MAG: thioredoxin family protein [Roseburia sp.]